MRDGRAGRSTLVLRDAGLERGGVDGATARRSLRAGRRRCEGNRMAEQRRCIVLLAKVRMCDAAAGQFSGLDAKRFSPSLGKELADALTLTLLPA